MTERAVDEPFPRYPENVERERLHRERTNSDDIAEITDRINALQSAFEAFLDALPEVVMGLIREELERLSEPPK